MASKCSLFSFVNTETKKSFNALQVSISDDTSNPALSISGPTDGLTQLFDLAYV